MISSRLFQKFNYKKVLTLIGIHFLQAMKESKKHLNFKYLEGEETSTNPIATLFAWTGALRKRGELDGIAGLAAFADKLEAASIAVIESGTMTKDLAGLWEGETPATVVNSRQFLEAIRAELDRRL